MSAPRFQHDCPACTWLGSFDRIDLYFELYYCPQPTLGLPTLIARYGSEGPEYLTSNLLVTPRHAVFRLAYDLAVERGLIAS
jgi:hypothetical protein